jgi:hypothetical protein
VQPERPPRRTHPDSGDRGSGDGTGKNGVGGGSSTDMDNDLRRRWRSPSPSLSSWGCDGRRDDDDGGRKGGRGVGEATTDYKATTRQQGCEGISYGAAGGRGNEAIDKSITNATI